MQTEESEKVEESPKVIGFGNEIVKLIELLDGDKDGKLGYGELKTGLASGIEAEALPETNDAYDISKYQAER